MNYPIILLLIFFLFQTNISFSSVTECEEKIVPIHTSFSPDEFQRGVILSSFLRDQIINDMTAWFVHTHFPYGKSEVWHRIDLEVTTIELSNYGINEKLVTVYYQSQLYCGVGGQCSTYLLRKIDNLWTKIESWHDKKLQFVYINSCENETVNITIGETNGVSLIDETREIIAVKMNN